MENDYRLSPMDSRPNPYRRDLSAQDPKTAQEYAANLGRTVVTLKSGQESFHAHRQPFDFNLLEFWQWSTSDLVSNATRGRLAEYIVAKALDLDTTGIRNEWDAFDLLMPSGIKIEVKSAAYLQSWHQDKPSSVVFRVPQTRAWDPETNTQSADSMRQADIYVFALLHHMDKATLDPLNVEQWSFYVLPTCVLNARTRSQHSITLKSLQTLAGGPVKFHQLLDAVSSVTGQLDPDTID